MKRVYLSIGIAILLGACAQKTIRGTYSFYDEYATQTRLFKNVVSCAPGDRSKIFVSHVQAIQHDEQAIHLFCKKENEEGFYVLIEANDNGFDCVDDSRSNSLSRTAYQSFCENRGYPILLAISEDK